MEDKVQTPPEVKMGMRSASYWSCARLRNGERDAAAAEGPPLYLLLVLYRKSTGQGRVVGFYKVTMADTKFDIGNDRYLVVHKYKGMTYISLRQFKWYVGSTKLYATEKGITLTVDNWLDLKMAFEDISKELSRLNGTEKVDYRQHIGKNVFVSVTTGWNFVDIRKWWMLDGEKLQPKRKGISLTPDEWQKVTQLAETLHKVVPELAYAIPCGMREDHQNQQGMLACAHCNPNSCEDWQSML